MKRLLRSLWRRVQLWFGIKPKPCLFIAEHHIIPLKDPSRYVIPVLYIREKP